MQTPLTTPDVAKQSLESKLGFQVIEIIGNQMIAAANDGELLIHCTVNASG